MGDLLFTIAFGGSMIFHGLIVKFALNRMQKEAVAAEQKTKSSFNMIQKGALSKDLSFKEKGRVM